MSFSTASRAVSAAALAALALSCSPTQPARVTASGVFEAIEVNVGVKVPGQLVNVAVDEGQEVKAGDLIAEVDCSDLAFQAAQARANAALAGAQLALAIKGARAEDVRQAESGTVQAAAAYDLARSDHERAKRLHEQGAVTKKILDDAQTRLTVAEAQKSQAGEVLAKVRRFTRAEEIAMARARVDAARTGVEAVEKKIGDCRVLAPIQGVVLRKVFESGEIAGPTATVAVLSDLKRIRAVVYLPEADVFKVKLGGAVDITTDGFPGRTFRGTVSHISNKAEFTPKNVQTRAERVKQMFAVKLAVENPDLALKPGLPMDVDFGAR